ncbi:MULTISPECIES: hypothetical protein [unclassified Frankia]|uniref:hypothetical protein n=1 Tax=unclassified Frankia TaxID=2632575 RepID=UPI001EF3E5F8|nr:MULTISPECIES: hypothetical protein [unclassified Frankia]
MTLPETVALARVLADLEWRCLVAIAFEPDLDRFYQHVAHRTHASVATLTTSWCRDPLRDWVARHRVDFADQRHRFQAQKLHAGWQTPVPPPEKGHFK